MRVFKKNKIECNRNALHTIFSAIIILQGAIKVRENYT